MGLHFILGLPGEDREMMLETVRRASQLPISTIKFHQLQILRNTRMAQQYEAGELPGIIQFSPESYAALCADILEVLRSDIAIDRFVASAPSELLIAPRWGLKNYQFTAILHNKMKGRASGA